jgi:L-alanine-DL-glutamate epimerase-like enolase superfamily enzyme
VAAALNIPVGGGEQDGQLPQFRRIIDIHAVDVIQPDVCYVGGLTRALRVARMADEAGLICMPHSANQSLVQVFTLHMLSSIPNAAPYMEFSVESSPWLAGLYDPIPTVQNGRVTISDAPGWGITINPAWLEKARHQVSEK